MALTLNSTVTLNTGAAMPLLGFGTWRVAAGGTARRAVAAALAIGCRLIDTASAYGNEEDVGAAIAESGLPRGEIFLTTKAWNDEQGQERTPAALRDSLARLGMDYVDLYLIHWPAAGRWPGAWRAMQRLRDAGLCRNIGVSNFEIHHLEELRRFSSERPAVNQVEFNPFLFRRDLLDYCRAHGIQLEGYSPLTRAERLHDPRLVALARQYGKTPAQVLIRWALQLNVVTIPKSSHPEHIRENTDVFDFTIDDAGMHALNHLDERFYGTDAWQREAG